MEFTAAKHTDVLSARTTNKSLLYYNERPLILKEAEREREGQRETERDRERHRERRRDRKRQREIE